MLYVCGDGEGEFHSAFAGREPIRFHNVVVHRVLAKVLNQGEEHPIIGLGGGVLRGVGSPEDSKGMDAYEDGIFFWQAVIVKSFPRVLEPASVGPASMEVDVTSSTGDGAEGGVVPVLGALFEGGEGGVVDKVWEWERKRKREGHGYSFVM
jgi:hypothetical protein